MSRKRKPIYARDVVAEIMATIPKLTDEEWAKRDAQVKANQWERTKRDRAEQWRHIRTELLDKGLSKRCVDEIAAGRTFTTPAESATRSMRDGITVLAGNVGCGKTYAAHLWLLRANRLRPDLWRPQEVCRVTATWFARQSRYGPEDKLANLATVRRLLIDDLGVEFADGKRSFVVDFDELLDIRWSACLPTVITCNLVADEFKTRYGPRIVDRIRGGGAFVNVSGPSLRGGGEGP